MRYESDYYAYNPYNPLTALKQHGIIGMKWGRWNEETRARYLGLNRRKKSEVAENRESLLKKGQEEFDKEYINLTKHKYKNPDMQGWSMKKYTTMKEARDAYAEEYVNKKSKSENKDLSSLPEAEKKKIDKKYFKESSFTVKTRVLDENGRYTDKWVTKEHKTHTLDAKKIIKDLDDDFLNKIDEEKKDFNNYEDKHLTEKKLVRALDEYWYGHDFSLNMFPVYGTEAEYKRELKDYWAKGADDDTINRIYDYMVQKSNYADRIESICKDEAKKLGISDSMIDTAKYQLYGVFVDNSKTSNDIKRQFSHSDSSDFYVATDPYDSRTTAGHHGIIGQKWGVWNEETRARYLGGGSKSKWFSKITDKFKKSEEEPHLKRTHLTKELAEISDAELNAAIKRMQLEQTYLQMLKNYPDASDKGKKYANQFTDNLFNQLTTGLGGAMGKRIAKAIDDWINDDSDDKEKYKKEARSKTLKELNELNAYEKAVETYANNQANKKK